MVYTFREKAACFFAFVMLFVQYYYLFLISKQTVVTGALQKYWFHVFPFQTVLTCTSTSRTRMSVSRSATHALHRIDTDTFNFIKNHLNLIFAGIYPWYQTSLTLPTSTNSTS